MPHALLFAALLEALVCPVCHQKLDPGPADGASESNGSPEWLRCRGCGRYYPIQDGIPVMLETRATGEPPKRKPR